MALLEVFMVLLNSFIAIFVAIIVYYKNCYNFWKNKKIPYLTPKIPLGNSQNPFFRKSSSYEQLKLIYDRMRSENVNHCGIYDFTTPIYFPIDLGVIKNVFGEQILFNKNYFRFNFEDDSKIERLFETILKCSQQMVDGLKKFENKSQPIDIDEVLRCFMVDVIKNCGFGVKSNGFLDDYLRFTPYKKFGVIKKNPIFEIISKKLKMLEKNDFFFEIVKESVKFREENRLKKSDFLQILIDENWEIYKEVDYEEKIALKALDFFSTSFKTAINVLTFSLYELAKNLDVQDKLRLEILKFNQFDYEKIKKFEYMNQVIEETLRKYPLVPIINKSFNKSYRLPGSDSTLEKGTKIQIATFAIQRDPNFFPKPDYFIPERFSNENKTKIDPLSYLPFGLEPKSSIGVKFGLLQTKIALTMLLKDYKVSLNFNTKDPLKFDKNNSLLVANDKIWLDVNKVN
nr:cytochrome P450 6a8-like [Onthophagus taurus]